MCRMVMKSQKGGSVRRREDAYADNVRGRRKASMINMNKFFTREKC